MILTIVAWFLMVFAVWYIPYRLRTLQVFRKGWLWNIAVALAFISYMLLVYNGIYTRNNFIVGVMYNVLGLLFVFLTYLFFFLCSYSSFGVVLGRFTKKYWIRWYYFISASG
ncbi:MAG: hypothetical protein UZ12_BCD005001025, partial [Bacteroidetes bacterium OLB12]